MPDEMEMPEVPDQLLVYRFVIREEAAATDDDTVKELRHIKRTKPGEFHQVMSQLERAYQSQLTAWRKQAQAKNIKEEKTKSRSDEGTEKAVRALENWLLARKERNDGRK